MPGLVPPAAGLDLQRSAFQGAGCACRPSFSLARTRDVRTTFHGEAVVRRLSTAWSRQVGTQRPRGRARAGRPGGGSRTCWPPRHSGAVRSRGDVCTGWPGGISSTCRSRRKLCAQWPGCRASTRRTRGLHTGACWARGHLSACRPRC